MRIERTADIDEVMKCLPYEREIRKKGRDRTREADTILFVQSQLENPLFGFWVAYDDKDNTVGYCCAFLSLVPGMKYLHLFRLYAKDKILKKEFENILDAWAREFKIKIAHITVFKNIKALKKQHFMPVSINMERRI